MDNITVGLLGIVTMVIGLFGWLLKKVMEENSKREADGLCQPSADYLSERYVPIRV